jgi:hypothetical protein
MQVCTVFNLLLHLHTVANLTDAFPSFPSDAFSRRALLAVPLVIGGLQSAGQGRAEEAAPAAVEVEAPAPAPAPAPVADVSKGKVLYLMPATAFDIRVVASAADQLWGSLALRCLLQMEELYDQILAYKFEYPTVTTSGKQLKMILSHPPEKYSSRW